MESEKTVTEENKKTGSSEELYKLFSLAMENKYTIALWRLPNMSSIHVVIDTDGFEVLGEIDLEELDKGFLLYPFQDGTQVFIRNHISYSTERQEIVFSEKVGENERQKFESGFNKVVAKSDNSHVSYFIGDRKNLVNTKEKDYLKIVEDSISAISSGHMEKVVPSRIKIIDFSQPFDVIENFLRLSDSYPRAFIYFVSAEGVGSWMGATPEVLIEIEDSKKFRTISLAGTQKFNPEINPGSVAWTQKEIEEQALVSRYIINCFKQIRLREFEERGPKTVIAGNLMHLKTTFEVDMEETGFHNLGTVMLKLLHPTSAVCGMPRKEAMNFQVLDGVSKSRFYRFI